MASLVAKKGNAQFSIEAETALDFYSLGYEILQPAYYTLTEDELVSLVTKTSTIASYAVRKVASIDTKRISLEPINIPIDNGGYAPEEEPAPIIQESEEATI